MNYKNKVDSLSLNSQNIYSACLTQNYWLYPCPYLAQKTPSCVVILSCGLSIVAWFRDGFIFFDLFLFKIHTHICISLHMHAYTYICGYFIMLFIYAYTYTHTYTMFWGCLFQISNCLYNNIVLHIHAPNRLFKFIKTNRDWKRKQPRYKEHNSLDFSICVFKKILLNFKTY